MDVSASGVTLSASDLDALIARLGDIARAHHVVALADVVDRLAIISAQLSALSTLATDVPTMTTHECAMAIGRTDRCVRYRIARGQIPAWKRDDGTWAIPEHVVGKPHKPPTNVG